MSNLTRDDVREMIEELINEKPTAKRAKMNCYDMRISTDEKERNNRKIGEWQQSKANKRVWHCSLCKRGYIIKNEKWWNYCPYCGSYMKGE